MNWCVSPAGTCPLPGPSQFFSSMFVGDGKWFFSLPHSPLPRSPSLPPCRRQRKGRGLGGAGLPLGTAVAQSISPKPRKFLLPKKKKKKKKSQRPPFLPAPLGQSRLDLWGSWEGGSGLEHSQARVVEFPGRPSARPSLGFSPLPTSSPLQATHQRWPSPAPKPLGLQAFTLRPSWGYCTALERVGGGTLAPSTPYPLSFPRAGHFLP